MPPPPRPVVVAARGRPGARWRAVLVGAAWVGALVASTALLWSAGSGPLAPPPVGDRAALHRWWEERDAVVAALALVRLVGLGLALYLLVVTALGLAARCSRAPALVATVDVVTVPAVRRALAALAGVSLTTSAATLAVAGWEPRSPVVVEADHREAEGPVTLGREGVVVAVVPAAADVRGEGGAGEAEGTATLRVDAGAGGGEPTPEGPTDPSPAGRGVAETEVVEGGTAEEGRAGETASAEPVPGEGAGGGPSGGGVWTVEPGDHLWHVAEATLARAWDRAPVEVEVVPYWQAVIAANRATLVDPANPDLVLPGQALALPAVPPPP